MNAITHDCIIEAVKENKAQARHFLDNPLASDFNWQVRCEWYDHLMLNYGIDYQDRAMRLLRLFNPCIFDEQGFIKDYEPAIYDIEVAVSGIVMRRLDRLADMRFDLQLETDYNEWKPIIEEALLPPLKGSEKGQLTFSF